MTTVRCLAVVCTTDQRSESVWAHVARDITTAQRALWFSGARYELDQQLAAEGFPAAGRHYSTRNFEHEDVGANGQPMLHWVNRGPNGYPGLVAVPDVTKD